MINIYNNLTVSAKYGLDNILQDYKKALLEEAYMLTKNREISLSDVLEAKERLKNEIPDVIYQRNLMTRKYLILALSGFIYTIIGLVVVIVLQPSIFSYIRNMENIGDNIAYVGVILASMGSLLTIMFMYKSHKQNLYMRKNLYHYMNEVLVVQLWSQIESIVHHLNNVDNDNSKQNISQVIDYLENTFDAAIDIKKILQVRNKIAHGISPYPPQEIEDVISMENQIVNKLESLLHRKIEMNAR